MRALIALLAMLTTPLLAYSGGVCRSRVCVSHVAAVRGATYAPVYAAPVVQYAVPLYSASYSSQQAGVEEKLERIAAALEKLALGKEVQGTSFEQVVTGRCASCHQDGAADKLGGGFVLQEKDGTLPPFSLAEQRRITQLVEEGKMPPKAPLSPAEKLIVGQRFAKKD